MEATTPISALIHAATMVNAGVYLLARFYPAFEACPLDDRRGDRRAGSAVWRR
jgi:NADH:ubiquinone oxidoreductase subunit 5 (subunit L)/multisubunit Na+/H+ antiporter MnhA subunit